VTYVGPGAAATSSNGHNGIEYGDMQLIAEAYDMLRSSIRIEAAELADVFGRWNRRVLSSFLIEITARIFAQIDPDTGKPWSNGSWTRRQKGTGKWTSQVAMDLGVATPTINAAVESRILSAYRDERIKASKLLRARDCDIGAVVRKLIDACTTALCQQDLQLRAGPGHAAGCLAGITT